MMTAAPNGQRKAASENEDAVKNAATKTRPERTAKEQKAVDKAVHSEPSKDTNARARKTTSGAAAEGQPLPKAEPEAVSEPGDEQRPAEDDNATPTGVARAENDPAKHRAAVPAEDDDDEDEDDDADDDGTNVNPDNVPDEFKNPLGLTGESDGKADQLKDRNIDDLEKGTVTVAELPEDVSGPNAPVPAGEVEISRRAKKGELSDPSGIVVERQKTGRQRAPKKDVLKELSDLTQLPIAAGVGEITASVDEYAGRAVLSISLKGWVGDAPLKILASDIGDLEQAIAELRSQLS